MGKSRHVVILGLVIAWAVAMFPGSAGAVVIFSGTLTGGAGLTGYDGWTDSTLSWEVEWDDTSKLWGYTYTFSPSPLSKDVSHFLIEASADDPDTTDVDEAFKPSNLVYWKPGNKPPEIGEYSADPYQADPPDNHKYGPNPYLPSDLYGIKFETDGYTDRNSVWFWTDRSPVWGDWYAKDGSDDASGQWAVAYNQGFGTTVEALGENWDVPVGTYSGTPITGVPTGWDLDSTGDYAWNYVLTPDTDTGGGFEIPEPNMGLLLLLGIIPVGIGVRLRRARKES